MNFFDLTGPGQISAGDTIICKYKDRPVGYIAEEILNPGSDKEEILVNKKDNIYFITSMAVDGTSWAKDVMYSPS